MQAADPGEPAVWVQPADQSRHPARTDALVGVRDQEKLLPPLKKTGRKFLFLRLCAYSANNRLDEVHTCEAEPNAFLTQEVAKFISARKSLKDAPRVKFDQMHEHLVAQARGNRIPLRVAGATGCPACHALGRAASKGQQGVPSGEGAVLLATAPSLQAGSRVLHLTQTFQLLVELARSAGLTRC